MADPKKLELTWIGKENRPRLEPRILLEDAARSYHFKHRVTEQDLFDNRLIFGDNLLALKALEVEFAGKVKCVYIDPPFNTKQAFDFYNDGLEHSIWLSLLRDRLAIIFNLLSKDGTLFVHTERSLLVLCTAFRARADLYPNLTVKKIPRQVLSRCEWGRDDYSLRVENLPHAAPQPGQQGFDFGPEDSS